MHDRCGTTDALRHSDPFRRPFVTARVLVVAAITLLGVALAVRPAYSQNGPLCSNCQFYLVAVQPDGVYDPNRQKNSSGNRTTFTVTNTGNLDDTYTFSCHVTGGITCTDISPPSQFLPWGQQVIVTVRYSVGSAGGRLTLDARGAGDINPAHDTGYKFVTTPPVITLIVPKATNNPDTALVHSRTPLILATYSADAPFDMSTLVIKLGSDTVTKLARRNTALAEWEVDSAHQLSPGVTLPLYVSICHVNASCSSVTRQVVLDNSGAPIVSFTGMPLELFGNSAEVETGFGIPAYYSMGVARSTGLVYS